MLKFYGYKMKSLEQDCQTTSCYHIPSFMKRQMENITWFLSVSKSCSATNLNPNYIHHSITKSTVAHTFFTNLS